MPKASSTRWASRLAGHADIKTTMAYCVEVDKAELRQAVAKLAAM